jgi:hypothetical protein
MLYIKVSIYSTNNNNVNNNWLSINLANRLKIQRLTIYKDYL